MPRWEEIVQWVVVESNYVRVEESADSWTRAFRRVDDLKAELTRLHDSITWQGRAATAFRTYLKDLAAALERTAEEHRTIADGMRTAAAALKEAVHSIPIPEAMYDQVIAMREAYHTNVSPPGLRPGIFYPAVSSVAGTDFAVRVEAWFTENEKKAQEAYDKLVRAYQGIRLPEGSGITPPSPRAPGTTRAPGGGTRHTPGTTAGQVPLGPTIPFATNPYATNPLATNPFATQPPITGPTGSVPPLASLPPDPSTDPGDFDTDPVSTDPVLPDLDPLDPLEPGTRLAGVDGSGFGGAGGGGLGGGGIGVGKLPSLGPAVAMPAATVAAGGQPGPLAQQIGAMQGSGSQAGGGSMVGAGAGGVVPHDGSGTQTAMSKLFDEDPRRTYGLRDADELPDGTVT
jgi:uncharacterized protein YukE